MTQDRDFKRLVRARAARTGESYTSARAALRASRAGEPSAAIPPPSPAAPASYAAVAGMSDEALAARTGCTWERWIWALDQVDAHQWPHAEIARYLGEKYKVPAWWRQTIAVGYERVRGLRERGQMRAGHYTVNKSRTYAAALSTLYRSVREPGRRAKWMPGTKLVVRSATEGKVVRFVWPDGSAVEVRFTPKGPARTSVAVQHARIASREEAERLRAWWGERLDALATRFGARAQPRPTQAISGTGQARRRSS